MSSQVVSQFMELTNCTSTVANAVLEMSGGSLDTALQLFFDNPGIADSIGPSPAAPSTSRSARRNAGSTSSRRVNQTVINVDSDQDDFMDEDEDEDYRDDDDDDDDVEAIAAEAQRNEDEELARRLQDEMYSQAGHDDVRAPIAQTTETLMEDDYLSAALEERHQRQMREHARARMHQSIWMDSDSGEETRSRSRGPPKLADMFRPPVDLMTFLSWDDARDQGKESKKWILVNLQDMQYFPCQALNRDIWKSPQVQKLVKEHFIFLQYLKDDPLAQEYISFYLAGQDENPDTYPYVAIIDPRTGEQVKLWSGQPFPRAEEFIGQMSEFLDRYTLSGRKNPVAKTAQRAATLDLDRMGEEEMLRLAMEKSLEDAKTPDGGSSSSSSSNNNNKNKSSSSLKAISSATLDPDTLTRTRSPTPNAVPASEKGKEAIGDEDIPAQNKAETGSVEVDPMAAKFAAIADNRPHTEPANGPSTTRIQFRLTSGQRMIRRFGLEEGVVRIFEWLKAEPPSDEARGKTFELKRMPEGVDLLESLGQSIQEAGLKMGTVVVEYL